MLGARVARRSAEDLRKVLASLGVVDESHHITEDGAWVVIPLSHRVEDSVLEGYDAGFVEADFRARSVRTKPIEEVRGRVDLSEELRRLVPDKWELLGDVLVIRMDSRLDSHETAIARAYAEVLGARTVLRDIGGISGEYREPKLRRLIGDDTVTVHKENGIRYRFDVSKIMFSSGNMEERLRMADTACDGETVVDMFAGIGYFTLPLAVHQQPRTIIACEKNPTAHGHLIENSRINRVQHRVRPLLGDNRSVPGESFADRVIMGYLRSTHEFLPTAYRMLRDGGIVHYHETCPNELLPMRPVERLRNAVPGHDVRILRSKEIKSYAPGVSHVVLDARLFKPS